MKASIIIPAYNAAERLHLNLTALNRQSWYGEDVEVIVIDNGSRDHTLEMLNQFRCKYPMTVLRVDKNRGIAHGRNQGVLKAKGDILIFHDSDMIASRDFVEKHIAYHEAGHDVVCGLFWKRIYSFFYSGFNQQQMEDFKKYGLHFWPNLNYKAAPRIQLITEQQASSSDLLEYGFDLDLAFIRDLKTVLERHGPHFRDYLLPWRFFITNNLSVNRKLVFDVGLFDEKIVRYGYEDYDLGLRLYKAGNPFVFAPDILSLHQEHPANYNFKDVFENIHYMCEKYNSIHFLDVLMVCLNEALKLDSEEMNLVMGDVKILLELKPYHRMLEVMLSLLQMVRIMHFKPEEPVPAGQVQAIAAELPQITKSARILLSEYHLTHFTNLLFYLFRLCLKTDLEAASGKA